MTGERREVLEIRVNGGLLDEIPLRLAAKLGLLVAAVGITLLSYTCFTAVELVTGEGRVSGGRVGGGRVSGGRECLCALEVAFLSVICEGEWETERKKKKNFFCSLFEQTKKKENFPSRFLLLLSLISLLQIQTYR